MRCWRGPISDASCLYSEEEPEKSSSESDSSYQYGTDATTRKEALTIVITRPASIDRIWIGKIYCMSHVLDGKLDGK